jgi:hypothetical protein
MNKLRLLVTKYCPKKCLGCCNRNWDLDSLPIVDNYDYDEILITGGEPLHSNILNKTLTLLKYLNIVDINPERKVIIYTTQSNNVLSVLDYVDGITLTIHHQRDVMDFIHLLFDLENHNYEALKKKSLRLNIFEGITLPDYANLSLWKVKKDMVWVENCPLPENEVFMRLKNIN